MLCDTFQNLTKKLKQILKVITKTSNKKLKIYPHKKLLRKKRMMLDLYPNISPQGFPTKHTNIKYKYETEGQIQHNSNNVLTVEIKMRDKKNRIILTIINMLT